MTERFQIYRLEFKGGLHINSGKPSYETTGEIHSDTMYAALEATYHQKAFDFPFPKFTLSSLFPYLSVDHNIKYFFLKPYLPKMKLPADEPSVRKKVKGVKWLELEAYENLLNGRLNYNSGNIRNEFLFNSKAPEQINYLTYKNRIRIRKGIELTDPSPFDFEETWFHKGSGLFFMVSIADSKELGNLSDLVRALGDSGIGSDRTSGLGQFIVEEDEIELSLPDKAEYATNLGLYLPASEEELSNLLAKRDHLSYGLIKRGGWLTFPGHPQLRKNEIYFFQEGGIFHNPNKGYSQLGRSVDLTPGLATQINQNIKVIRNGRSLFLPLIPAQDEI